MVRAIIKSGVYHDSVTLMLATREVNRLPGIDEASIVMATKENLAILKNAGMLPPEMERASENDLIIAVKAQQEEQAKKAMQAVDQIIKDLRKRDDKETDQSLKSLDSALQIMPDANLALISVAGKHAVAEARKALESGLHVMLFSDNISLENEKELKMIAHEKGLLMMGPDCGTAIINGVPLAFANVVERGNIGIVGASGTGIQEVSSIISNNGGGVSQAIGTGGRDLHKEIGGIMFLDALEALANDDQTAVICLISKPPHPDVLKKISESIQKQQKPVVALFIGADSKKVEHSGAVPAGNLEEAALISVALSMQENPQTVYKKLNRRNTEIKDQAQTLVKNIKGKYLRGMFSGGTLCDEAQLLLANDGIKTYSNTPLDEDYKLKDIWKSQEHTIIDLGEDAFTTGRPHPMIDFGLRNKRILQEAADKDVAVILFDVVLGYGAHLNPADELTPIIKKAKNTNPTLIFVCSVTGTEADPQNLNKVKIALEDAGVTVMPSMSAAAELCSNIVHLLDKRGCC
ncbi:MAG: acyl-CoA synthetase FdrA [Bacteroidia bacterium]|nr:MAG: acyl-CoA synthetase FdrA [Bacteroidia bacterium]